MLDLVQNELADAGRATVIICSEEDTLHGNVAEPQSVDVLDVHKEPELADVGHELVVLLEEGARSRSSHVSEGSSRLKLTVSRREDHRGSSGERIRVGAVVLLGRRRRRHHYDNEQKEYLLEG